MDNGIGSPAHLDEPGLAESRRGRRSYQVCALRCAGRRPALGPNRAGGGAPTKDGAGRSVPTIAQRNVTVYSRSVIRSFRHKGLQRFFETGSKAGIQASHGKRLARMLSRLDAAGQPRDLNVPGWHLHALTGDLAGH